MDIIVTTPKSQMKASAQEAADCIAAGGGEYFRRFGNRPTVLPGNRIYYVEDGYVRGFCRIGSIVHRSSCEVCQTTGRRWPPGTYLYMQATTWQWITPIPMNGFQGFRYAKGGRRADGRYYLTLSECSYPIEIVGGWLDPKPEVTNQSPIGNSPRPALTG